MTISSSFYLENNGSGIHRIRRQRRRRRTSVAVAVSMMMMVRSVASWSLRSSSHLEAARTMGRYSISISPLLLQQQQQQQQRFFASSSSSSKPVLFRNYQKQPRAAAGSGVGSFGTSSSLAAVVDLLDTGLPSSTATPPSTTTTTLSSPSVATTTTTTISNDEISPLEDRISASTHATNHNLTAASQVLAAASTFVKPDRDPRSYRAVRLSNNLNVLLVCDETATAGVGVEAASVHVQAGHFDDAIPGLARTCIVCVCVFRSIVLLLSVYWYGPLTRCRRILLRLDSSCRLVCFPFSPDFHEHMLFLGTQKYPDEDDYENFLSQYGGFSNAYTDMEDTNYFFSITTDAEECFAIAAKDSNGNAMNATSATTTTTTTTEALRGALDRFAQFFIAPKFDRDMVDRELQAIDSEYRNGKTSDAWRNYQMLKSVANQNHPFSNFGCGNYETLMSEGQESLLLHLERFWKDYYQTYNLRLAVVGHGSLDALQSAVESTFGQIPFSAGAPRRIKNVPGQTFIRENAVYGGNDPENLIAAFGKEQLGVYRQIIPYTETRNIKVLFATPPLDDPAIQQSKAYRALSHFLGHESPGSLHAVLNELGYLTSLSCGLSLDTTDFSLFSITLALTPQGMNAKDQVLDLVFQWIALLREQCEDLLAAYHNELRMMADMSFRFRENGDPTDFCSQAAEQLFEEGLDPSRVLIVSNEASEYDPVVERAFLDRLRPENCMVSVFSSDLDGTTGTWNTEKWYGAKYTEEKISPKQIELWDKPPVRDGRLWAPTLNEFIPTDLSLRCDDAPSDENLESKEDLVLKAPTLMQDRPTLRLWHKMDRFWRVPKAFVKTSILSPSTYQSPRSMTLNRIFQRVLNDDLNSYVYDASLAGCNYRVSCTANGYRISVKGYSEKLPFLLDTLTTRIISLIEDMKAGNTVLRAKFQKALQGLLRETKNFRLDSPYEVASYNCRLMIEENVWYLDNYVAEMEGEQAERHPLTMEECAAAAEESLMGRVKCEALCIGNINEKEALEVANVLDRHFLNQARILPEVESPKFRSLKIPTRDEAALIFGPDVKKRRVPIVYQELAVTETEENNAIELILQAGSDLSLGYEGLALLDLICHMAYNSAFGMLRTKEQLGYIVSAHARRTAGGGWGMSLVIQSSVALPDKLEERGEAWLKEFRREIKKMTPESIAQEASSVSAQFLESDTKMSQEVTRAWGEILQTEGLTVGLRSPVFNRVQILADELVISDEGSTTAAGTKRKSAKELKQSILSFFDQHFAESSPTRRIMSARVFSHSSKAEFEASLNHPGVLSTHADIRYVKQFLSSWPIAPYWRKIGSRTETR